MPRQTAKSAHQQPNAATSYLEYFYSDPGFVPSAEQVDLPTIISPEGSSRESSNPSRWTSGIPGNRAGRQGSGRPTKTGASDMASLVLNAPFQSLFASLYNRREKDLDRDALSLKGDIPNPFTKPRSSSDTGAGSSTATPAAPEPSQSSSSTGDTGTNRPDPPSNDNSTNTAMGGAPQPRYTFLGDFSGGGVLQSAYAKRAGTATFAFADGMRTFVLVSNGSAAESQRSFALEDMNGDGQPDILQTSGSGLFGAVMLGDGSGNFHYSGYFLTAYEPSIPLPGPMGDGGREIVTVNPVTGVVTMFRPAPIYVPIFQSVLPFLPDYAAPFPGDGGSLDYLLAAQIGTGPYLYQWSAEGAMSESPADLPSGPTITINGNPTVDAGMRSLQVYQAGSYASIVLTDNLGHTFNVANVRVIPGYFLVIGDIEGHGTLDVGIARLLPAQVNN